MTVVRLADRSLALISPVPIDDALSAEIEELGQVAYLLAPNLMHHLHLRAAFERYPGARLLGPAGLAKKQARLKLNPLDIARHPALRDTFAAESIGGAPSSWKRCFYIAPREHLSSPSWFSTSKRPLPLRRRCCSD
jgi:hypothetical protein